MTFRNPWIDPRIADVLPEGARAYLYSRGWRRLGPAANPILDLYEGPGEGDKSPSVLLPLHTDRGPMLQRMIDLVGEVAHFEGRYAGSVIDDMLREHAHPDTNGNGRDRPSGSETAKV